MAQHPHQCILAVSSLLVTASCSTLSTFDTSSPASLATSSPHTGYIRQLASHTDSTTGVSYLVSTGEDKLLVVSALPSLEVLSSRTLIKRANALDMTEKGEILVGDKFGDVYHYALLPPAAPVETKDPPTKLLPILGHVSMLNSMAYVPPTAEGARARVVTGDRDSHVRVSRYPAGHCIETYLTGSKEFVAALAHVPATDASPEIIVSGGGDSSVRSWNLRTGEALADVPIHEHLHRHCIVQGVVPPPIFNKRRSAIAKGKRRAAAEAEGDEPEESSDEEASRKGITVGIAVHRIAQIGAGVVVLSAGCTAVLYIPAPLLQSLTSTLPPSVLDLHRPILDIAPVDDSSFYVTLDVSRGSAPSIDTAESAIRLVQVVDGALVLLDITPLNTLVAGSGTPVSDASPIPPTSEALYPLLSLLHHVKQDDDEVDERPTKGVRASAKRPRAEQEGEVDAEGNPAKIGKRAQGRLNSAINAERARLEKVQAVDV